MKTKYLIWLPFNRQTPETWRWKKTIGNKNWWPLRIETMKKFTIPSILSQDTKVEAVAIFSETIKHYLLRDTIDLLEQNGISHYTDTSRLTKEERLEPFLFMQKFLLLDNLKYDALCMIRLDSDDLYLKHAMTKLTKVEQSEGKVIYFGQGYVYDIEKNKLAEYKKSHMPFYATTFTKEALRNDKMYLEYRKDYSLDFNHWQITKTKNNTALGNGAWIHTWNNNNTKDATNAWKKSQYIGKVFDIQTTQRILGKCGVKI